MTPPVEVLQRFALPPLCWQPIGEGASFSGATIWRGEQFGEPALALKAWPKHFSAEQLQRIHHWMRIAEPCDILPRIVSTTLGQTFVPYRGQLWEVATWMPGKADFAGPPSDARLADALQQLAALHRVWAKAECQPGVSEGVRRRVVLLQSLADDNALSVVAEPIRRRLWEETRRWLPKLKHISSTVTFPCLCDPWQAHWLFAEEKLMGIIDTGAMRLDHPAIDLARMLGDMAHGNEPFIDQGVAFYNNGNPPVPVEPEFVRLLNRTGQIYAIVGWCRRLADAPASAAAHTRFQTLLDRFFVSDTLFSVPSNGSAIR